MKPSKGPSAEAASRASSRALGLILFFGFLFCAFSASAQLVNPQDDDVAVSAIVFSSSPAVQIIGGGGVPILPNVGSVLIFRGYAYPGALVTLYKNGEIAAAMNASADASFEIALSHQPIGKYSFVISAKEIISGDMSPFLKFADIDIQPNSNIVIDGIFFPPTLHQDKSEVLQGENINFFGRTAPGAKVELAFPAAEKFADADALGYWSFAYGTSGVAKGNYYAKAKATLGRLFSLYSEPAYFKVGEQTVKADEEIKPPKEIEIPLYPEVPLIPPITPSIVAPERPEIDYSLWYLLLLLLPILLLIFDRKKEKSYGVIPTHLKDGELLYLIVKTAHGDWSFPRGHRERGESETDAAFRELLEETGIKKCTLENKIFFTEIYHHTRGGRRRIKENKYFLGFVEDMKVAIDKKEIVDYKWGTFGETFDLLSYDSTRKVLIRANDTISIRK